MAEHHVTVVVRVKAKPGKEARVKEALYKLLAPTRAEQGCLNFDMHQSPVDPAVLIFHENWVREEDLARHFQTPHITRWIQEAGALLAEPMELTRWQKVE